ncbi:Helicase superfamily 1/2, DinG/Rad3-like protein, partial [Aduncisulcus paluster]
MGRSDAWARDNIEAVAREHRVCPFEFSLDLALWADLVICDYNYAFDPRVYLKRFFDESSDDYLFLIDEAHNLVDRAREMYSAELTKEKIMSVKRALPKWNEALIKALEKMNKVFLTWSKTCEKDGYFVDYNPPDEIYPQVRKFLELAEDWLLENQAAECYEEVLELYFESMRFMRIYEIYDDCYISLYER